MRGDSRVSVDENNQFLWRQALGGRPLDGASLPGCIIIRGSLNPFLNFGLVEAVKLRQNPVMKNEEDIHPEAAVAPGYLASHAERVFNRATETALRSQGTSLTLLGPLLWLSWRGPMLQRDLVKASAVKQPAMVATLDKLEAAGLIERTVVLTNKRAAKVSITKPGLEVAAAGRQALLDTNARGMEGFSAEEASLFVALLKRFIVNLED